MKMQLKLMLLLFGVSFITLMGCRKHDRCEVTIIGTNLAVAKPGTLTGTFTATGALQTSGTHVMVVEPVGADSIYCTWTLTAPKGTIIILQNCSTTTMTGIWNIISGTGAYTFLKGKGTLTMSFPPDPIVPPGALGVETMPGVIWWHS